jgi:hypothetical protein
MRPRTASARAMAIALGAAALAAAAGVSAGRVIAPGVTSRPVAGVTTFVSPLSPAQTRRLARLDRVRVDGRAALEDARTRTAQASLARDLGEAHRTAADSLGTTTLTSALLRTASGYAKLAGAATAGAPARFDAARRRVRAAENELALAVDNAGTPRAVPSPPSRSRDPGDTWLALLVLIVLGSAAAGAATGRFVNHPAAMLRRLGRGG